MANFKLPQRQVLWRSDATAQSGMYFQLHPQLLLAALMFLLPNCEWRSNALGLEISSPHNHELSIMRLRGGALQSGARVDYVGGPFSHRAVLLNENKGGGLFTCFCNTKRRRQRILNQKLWAAARTGDTEQCKALVEKGAQLDSMSTDESLDPALYYQHLYGFDHIEERERCLAEGIDPRAPKKPSTKPPPREGAGRTALRWAAWAGHAHTVQELIKMGADINATDPQGWNAVHEASMYGHTEVLRVLIDSRADLEAETYAAQWRPLHMAAVYGHLDMVKMLHEAGVDLCAITDGKLTAMDWSKAYGYHEVASFLRDAPGTRTGQCSNCGRSNFFVQGGIESVISTM